MSEILIFPATVTKVEEHFESEHVSGFGTDTVMRPKSLGWHITFDRSFTVFCGYGKPEFYEGDRVSITIKNLTERKTDLGQLLIRARQMWDAMTPEARADMIKKKGEGWAKSEAQWARDFASGLTPRD